MKLSSINEMVFIFSSIIVLLSKSLCAIRRYCLRFATYSLNPFHATGLFLYPMKTLENQRFSDVFRGIEGDQ